MSEEKQQVENDPTHEIARQRAASVQARIKAEAIYTQKIQELRKLEKISKGAGKPTLAEFIGLYAAIGAAHTAFVQEVQGTIKALTQAIFQGNMQSDAVLKVLIAKEVVSEEDIKAAVDTIIEEQKAIAEEQKSAALKGAFDELNAK